MVNSITGSAPYSYLNQLQGKQTVVKTPPVVDDTDTSNDTSDAAQAAAALNLPSSVLSLLQNADSDNTVSSLLSNSSSTDQVLQLLGENTDPTVSDILTSSLTNVLDTGASAGLYKAALNAAADKKASSFSSDYISKVLDAYHAAINQNNPVTNSVNTTG